MPRKAVMPLYAPSQDLKSVNDILKSDAIILALLDLSGQKLIDRANAYIAEKTKGTSSIVIPIEKACQDLIKKNIIPRRKWYDLIGSEKRLCNYFIPARRTRNESFFEEVMEIDCHVPESEEDKAWQIQERVFKLFHEQKVNNRYLYAEPPLGELPTMSGFFCCGTRFSFYRKI